jgi:3D (Asp-Asp-Asp) domain-containing protein
VRARLARCCGAVALALGGAAGIPAASFGDDPAQQADELRRLGAVLAQKERSASLELYALESRQAAAAAALAAVERRTSSTEQQLADVAARRAAARATLREARRLLGLRLRTLYEAGDTDPLAFVLGADSLQEALDGLDGLRFAAQQDREIIARTKAARRQLARLANALETRRATLARLRAEAADRVAALGRAAAERRGYLGRLAAERGLNESSIASLEAEAKAAQERGQRVSAATSAAAAQPEPPETPGTLTVRAVGYSLEGSTATGVPVGWGIVAVDPSIIPLGTRLTIPGYGEGVAADTGSEVSGATIDLWFPSRAQALAWGSRTITITLHS